MIQVRDAINETASLTVSSVQWKTSGDKLCMVAES